MNFADPMNLIALAVLGGVVIFVLMRPKQAAALIHAPQARQGAKGRALIDAAKEAGLDGAGVLLEQKLGEHETKQFVAALTAAFNGSPPANPTT